MRFTAKILALLLICASIGFAQSPTSVESVTSNSATLRWTVSSGEKYDVELPPGTRIKSATNDDFVNVTGLTPGTSYSWQVKAVNAGGESDWAQSTFTTLTPLLDAPTNLQVSNVTSNSATLSWDGPGQGAKFELRVVPGNLDDDNARSPYSLSSLSPNTVYTWQVRTTKNNDSSAWVDGPSFTTSAAPPSGPDAPTNLQVSNVTSNSATLSWDGPGQGAKFELRVVPGNLDDDNARSPYSLSSLSPSTVYTWQVRTTKNNDSSAWVDGPSFTTQSDLPLVPTLVSPSDGATGVSTSVTLSWSSSTGATSYRVQVSTHSNFPSGQTIKDDTTSGTSTTVSGLSSQTTYYWRVKASNAAGTSGWSSSWSFTVASGTTSAEQIGDAIPSEFRLSQNYPNPFNPSTTIEFSLPKSSYVKVLIYNTLGHLIHTLVDETLRPGVYRKQWVATGVASGIYFYRIQAGGFVETKRVVLVK